MKTTRLVLILIVLVGVGGGIYYWLEYNRENPLSVLKNQSQINSAQTQTTPQYPVQDQDEASENANGKPGKHLYKAGQTLEEVLNDLFGKDVVSSLFNLDDIARRTVVTVDNLVGSSVPSWNLSPLKPLESDFLVTRKGGQTVIAPANFKRYAPYINLVKAVDSRKLVIIYVHFYNMFQTAYRDLGTSKYFNDRLVEVIDDILKTPDIKDSVKVTQPTKHNRYKFVDVRLENLSAGQKILIRMGSENTQVVKAKLREIRKLLIHLGRKKRLK